MSQLFSLLYASKSNIDIYSNMDALDEITNTSKTNNSKVGISGALLFCGNSFIQVLEGPEEAVRETYARIENDNRHEGCIILNEGPIEARQFAQWDMASTVKKPDEAGISDIYTGHEFDPSVLPPEVAMVMLKNVPTEG